MAHFEYIYIEKYRDKNFLVAIYRFVNKYVHRTVTHSHENPSVAETLPKLILDSDNVSIILFSFNCFTPFHFLTKINKFLSAL